MSDHPPVDVHFGPDDEMLAWAKEEGLEIIKDKDGNYDWSAIYENWIARERQRMIAASDTSEDTGLQP